MRLETQPHAPRSVSYTKSEQLLVDRTKKAVAAISHSLTYDGPGVGTGEMKLEAVVWKNPLRIDFRASNNKSQAHAYVGPVVPLDRELFERDGSLENSIQKDLTKNWRGFAKYWSQGGTKVSIRESAAEHRKRLKK